MLAQNEVRIGGITVDINNPCAVLAELRKVEIAIATGETVAMTRFGEDEVRFTEASGARLEKLIGTYERLCARASGQKPRSARVIRWR